MSVVLLSLVSAAMFGAMAVAVRIGLGGAADTAGATLAMVLVALTVALVAAAARHDLHGVWPFLVAGLVAPGASQVLLTSGIREIGASRTSVVLGTAPLVAVVIALVFLGEPLRAPLALGALAIVAGGILLGAERDRPGHLRGRGLALAAAAAALFAARDDLVRALHAHAAPESAAAAALLSGTVVVAVWARRPPTRLEVRRLAPAGLLFGVSYVLLFEAYWRGRVSVVSPLVATESLWGVFFAALQIRHAEGVGRRLAFGALLVVAGGAVIGAAH